MNTNIKPATIVKSKPASKTSEQAQLRAEAARSRQTDQSSLAMKDTDRGMNIMSDAPRCRSASPNSAPASQLPESASLAASELFDDLMLTALQSLPDATPQGQASTSPPVRAVSSTDEVVATIGKLGEAALAAEMSKPAKAEAKATASASSGTVKKAPPTPIPISNKTPTSSPASATTPPLPAASSKDSSASDDEVLRRVADCLASRDIASFTRVGVDVRWGIITVRGDVASQGERMLLLHLLRKIPGVEKINDGLSIISARPVAVPRAARRENISFAWPNVSEWLSAKDTTWGAAAVLLIGAFAFWFWPSGSSRPVAVHPVKGKAVMEGAPMAGAHLVLHPDPNSKIPAGITSRGTVADDGSFELTTFDLKDGAPSGEFVVTVVWSKPIIVDGETQSGPSLVSAVYSKPESSPLRIKIAADTKELEPLQVKKLDAQAQAGPLARSSDERE